VPHVDSGAAVLLGDRGQVDIVLEHDRPVEVVPQGGEQAPVPAGQVPGERDLATLRVDQARGTQDDPADALDRGTGGAGGPDDRGVDDLDRVVALANRDVGTSDDSARDIRHAGDDVCRAGVHADDVRGGRHDRVRLRVGASAAGLLADAGHQAALLQ